VLTGRHAARSGLIVDVPWGECSATDCSDVLHPYHKGHLPTGEITLAEALKKDATANYATAALSKWHLGYALENGTQHYLPQSAALMSSTGRPPRTASPEARGLPSLSFSDRLRECNLP